jgi:hypothetical protein
MGARGGVDLALAVDLQRAIEGELKGPILCLTHHRSTSAPPRSRPKPRLSMAPLGLTTLVAHLENGNPGLLRSLLNRTRIETVYRIADAMASVSGASKGIGF